MIRRSVIVAVMGCLLACCGLAATASPTPSSSAGLAAWQKMYMVMMSPRCLNCHTATNFPAQGDDRHRHLFNVVRGPRGHGVAGLRCATCHQDANADSAGVPGVKDWHLAPLPMAWQDTHGKPLSSAALARLVSDRSRNGNLDGPGLVEHMQTDLVAWAWHPGRRRDGTARSVPPITQQQFIAATRAWVQAGMPIPQNH